MNESPICIYHDLCADGFAAAWVVRRALGAVGFHPGIYGAPPPDVAGRDAILVDFSYPRPVLEAMVATAASLTILDHHATACADLAGLEGAITVFDLERSGAGIAWDYFFRGQRRPRLIDHIEDRDLWRFALPGTREICAAVFSYPYEFGVWDRLMVMELAALRREGEALERKHVKDLEELLRATRRTLRIGGHRVPVANVPHHFASDAGGRMATGQPFAATYYDTPEGRSFSLRSTPDGIDVSEIARRYGGGGHPHAAGFRVGRAQAMAMECGQHDVVPGSAMFPYGSMGEEVAES